jgi:shikimate dehydrogenase
MRPTHQSGESRVSPQSISVETAVCGIILHPAGHTRSPAMHNAAYGVLGLDAVYLAFDVPPDALAGAVEGIRSLGLRQVAVSIPHKQEVIAHLDRVDDVAGAIGAVNTVTRVDGALVGTNTDWSGALRALERETPVAGRHAVVLGAGGAARAVVYGLLREGASVTVLNRTRERAEELAEALGAQAAGGLDELEALDHQILVNTTSVGLRTDESPVPASALRPGSVVMDAVYDPEETRLLRDARTRGATPIGGKWMLVHQAAAQLELWSGQEAPIDSMASAFDQAGA